MAKVTVNITDATEVDAQGLQTVSFDLVYGGKTIVSSTLEADVDTIKQRVTDFATAFKVKYTSVNKLKAGDTFDINV